MRAPIAKRLELLARQLSLYVVFAGVATAVDMAALYALTEWLGVYYLASVAIAYLLGMATNYSLNKTLTFGNRSRRVAAQFGVFILVALGGLGINLIVIYLLVEHAHLWYMYAKVIAIAVALFWSFFGHKHITFGLIR